MIRVEPRDVRGLSDYAPLGERLAAPDGGVVDLAADYVVVTASRRSPS